MHRIKFFLLLSGILTLVILSACNTEPQSAVTSAAPTGAPIMSGLPNQSSMETTRTRQPQTLNTPLATPVPGTGTGTGAGNGVSDLDGIESASSGESVAPITSQNPSSIEGSWLWSSITDPSAGTKKINNPSNYRLFIHEDTISLITNCNFTLGSIDYDGSNISISVDESSLSNCPIEEQQFVEKLNSANKASIANGRLQLNLAGTATMLELGAITNTPPATWDDLLYNMQDPFHENYCDAPGAILLANGQEASYLNTYGVASIEADIPIEFDTPMEIGSNSKSFTNVIILQLQEEGRLTLDDPLSAWLPDVASQLPNGDQITLRHLAQNTSGIPDYADPLIQPAIDNINQEAIQQSYLPQDLVNIALNNVADEAPFTPGEGWQYSTTNFILLGMIAEQITEQPLATLYQERIFDPLGMTSSSLPAGIPELGTVSQGYYTVNNNLTNFSDWNTSQGWAGGGIISTAEDMDKYIRGLLNGKLFQSIFTLTEMLDFMETGGGQFEKYGLGIGQFSNATYQAWGHEGQTPGFMSSWMYVPEADAVVVLLTNSGSCTSIIDLPSKIPAALFGLTDSPVENINEPLADNSANSCALYDLSFPHPEPDYATKRIRDMAPFAEVLEGYDPVEAENLEATLQGTDVLDLQALFNEGQLTSEALVTYYLYRIQTYDIGKLNSVMELNPEALAIAQALDEERAASGPRSPMHGIPVLLKDNIATGDGMHTTAGAYVLKDWQSSQDAFLVQQLRDAGAIILGKANMSEWANWMDECMPNGFSTLGGQTRNPYGAFEVSGSSSGSAAAVAANLTTVGIGTETQGSIISPARNNSVVGLKPSMGMVSRDNVIPLLPAQDVPGPIGRNVTDVAVLLSALTGVDDNDPETQGAEELAGIDFTQFITTTVEPGTRVGIVIIDEDAIQETAVALNFSDKQTQTYRDAVVPLNEAARQTGQLLLPYGIEIVEVSAASLPGNVAPNGAIEYGFKVSLNQFLTNLGGEAPIGSLSEIIALNEEDLVNHAPYGQSHLLDSENTAITADEFATIVEENRETAVSALSAIFTTSDIDVLISDVGQAYAPAGYPAITIPNGYTPTGEPQGIVFVGDYLSEPQLLTMAYIYEQATQARIEPNLAGTMQQIESILEPEIEDTPEDLPEEATPTAEPSG